MSANPISTAEALYEKRGVLSVPVATVVILNLIFYL